MNRLLVVVGMLASSGLAYATAGLESPAVHGSGTANRGRLEFVHARAPATVADPALAPDTPDTPGTPPAPDVQDPTASGGTPKVTDPAPEPPPEPELPPETPEVTDITLCIAEKAVARRIKVPVRVHLDVEGVLYWVTKKGATELPSQRTLGTNLRKAYGHAVIVVPDQLTNWQEVKHTLETARKQGAPHIYLGCGTPDEPTKMRTLSMDGAETLGAEGDRFVVKVKEGKEGPKVEVNGKEIETFPVDLAMAWNGWKKDHPGTRPDDPDETPVVLDAHRFTPMSQVVQVIDVLRGLGITHELHAGEAWVRKRTE